jgi:hypothetical protein
MKIVVAFMVFVSIAAASAQVPVFEKLVYSKPTQISGSVKAPPPAPSPVKPPKKGK